MTRDPRVTSEQLFGDGGTELQLSERRQISRSILDWVSHEVSRLKKDLGANDKRTLNEYLDDIREVERRIQKVEEHNASASVRELPDAPIGVPDSWEEHVKLMLDLQVLAFTADVTRVSTMKFSRDVSNRVFAESGCTTSFQTAFHSAEEAMQIEEFSKINMYHH